MTIKVHDLKPAPGSSKARKRVGRGIGGKGGKTAGRGTKGQKARGQVPTNFEGGQMPLHMRMPKRGFNSRNRKDFAEVNLWRIEQAIAAGKLDAKAAIDADVLLKAGVIRRAKDGVKLLGTGELKSKLDLTVYSATASARAAVEKAGGKLTTTKPEAAAAEA
jgi:large subunit ribosomal protein L15